MNKTLYIIISLFFLGCGQFERKTNSNKKIENNQVKIIKIDSSKITIIPFDTAYHWIFKDAKLTELTEQDLKTIEKILNDCITDYNPEQERQYDEINKEHSEYNLKLEHFVIELDNYNRQYVPVINDKGEKEVWINCFCETWDSDWKNEIMEVDDGGNCYFNLKINLTKEKYYDLMVNGVA